MANVNQKVLALVRREIEKDPHVPNDVLAKKAAAIDRSVRKLSKLQFHGTYRLTAAREIAAQAKPRNDRRRTASTAVPAIPHTADRDAVRATLVDLAKEVAGADKAALIRVLGSLDRYVDRVVAAT